MKRILVPIKNEDDAAPAAMEAIRQARLAGGTEIHLLNVQPRMLPEATLALAPFESVEFVYSERSRAALAPAEKLLSEAGVAFTSHRSVGNVAEGIVEKQRDLDCDSIVMNAGIRPHKDGWHPASIPARVQEMAQVPVTLVHIERPRVVGRRHGAR